ncbi:hypothetical protein FB446DRAFT_705272 [Lentinula raphanica]|nr:hypothetical protein FB446DRAFT_705272 [Lentinula raphanica]
MYVSGPDTKSDIPEAGSPPPYAASDPSSSSSSPPFVLPDSAKPSNYLSLSQTHNSFRGTYVIDPSLEIPSEYLPPLPDGENEDTQSNFYARSTHGNYERFKEESPLVYIVGTWFGLYYNLTGTTIHGSIMMSDAVSSQAMVFSDVQGVKRIFIGDMSTCNEGIEDSLFLESAHGSIRIYFEDEDLTPPIVKSMIGIWSKMFGRG